MTPIEFATLVFTFCVGCFGGAAIVGAVMGRKFAAGLKELEARRRDY